MTSIAYRDGVLASDSGCFNDEIFLCLVKKVVRGIDGALGASCGSAYGGDEFHKWMRKELTDGQRIRLDLTSDPPDFEALFIAPNGEIYSMNYSGYPLLLPHGFHCIGSNTGLMTGAMAAGASAERAIEIAIEYGESVKGPIQSERLVP